jgi:MoxR-like ATPase
MKYDHEKLTEKITAKNEKVKSAVSEIKKVIVGQRYLIERLLIGLFTSGHILVEGIPGLAKTLAVHTMSDIIQAKFQRIQFTPDLLPADILGTLIYNHKDGNFVIKKGPVFSNIILADEINRSPAKVQSALLEAMQERQVTIGTTTFSLTEPFMVLATQNPIEQEGTYPLPEAQVDRFMLKLNVTYPNKKEELEIINRNTAGKKVKVKPVLTPLEIVDIRKLVNLVYVDDKIKNYILDLVFATREPTGKLEDIKDFLSYGASPRASIYLTMAAKAHAFLRKRSYIVPEDVKAVGADVLRHRVILSYEAEAEEITPEYIVKRLFESVQVP